MIWFRFLVKRCWTGRYYVHLGPLCVGFGPVAFVERVWWRSRMLYYDYPAYLEGVRRRHAEGWGYDD